MAQDYLYKLQQDREKRRQSVLEHKRSREFVNATDKSGEKVSQSIKQLLKHEPSVNIKNDNLAKTEDLRGITEAINQLNFTTFLSRSDNWNGIVEKMANLLDLMQAATDKLDKNELNDLGKFSESLKTAIVKLDKTLAEVKKVKLEQNSEQAGLLREINTSLQNLEVSPAINMPPPEVTVQEKEVDFSPLIRLLHNVDDGIKTIVQKETVFDMSELSEGLASVEQAVRDLIARPVPVPEHPLPFKNSGGQGVQARVDGDGNVQVDINAFPGLIDFAYNYISVAYPNSTTEVYTYKTGGSSGATAATITVVYTDSTKANISSVART